MKRKDIQPRLLYPVKLPFKIEGQIKTFPDKQKLKWFITPKPVLYEMLKILFKKKKKIKNTNNKIAINTYLSVIESKKKQNKQTSSTETDS